MGVERDMSELSEKSTGLQTRGIGLVHRTEELRARINACEADGLQKVKDFQFLIPYYYNSIENCPMTI